MWKTSSCATALLLSSCAAEPEPRCGPDQALVRQVIDGDTVELSSGERVRYLLIDTPETGGESPECFGPEARAFNRSLVEGRRVSLRYDTECRDRYGRLLAYVTIEDIDVNARLVAEGYACVLHIPPNGTARVDDFEALQTSAAATRSGLWDVCGGRPCD